MLLSLLTTLALASDLHWTRLPSLPQPPDDLVEFQGGLLARTPDGHLYRWDGHSWQVAAPPHRLTTRSDHRLVEGARGAVWAWKSHPPAVARFDGVWGEEQSVAGGYLTGITEDDRGGAWLAGLSGTAWERTEGAWSPLTGLSGNLLPRADGHGGVWMWTTEGDGTLIHMRDGRRRRFASGLPTWSHRHHGLVVDAQGEAHWVADAWYRTEGDEVVQVSPQTPTALALRGDESWGVLDRDAWHPATDRRIPLPARTIERLVLLEDGPWVLADGAVFHLEEGHSVVFQPTDLNLPDLSSSTDVRSGDLDGDGRADLVVSGEEGVALYLQRDGGFPLHRVLLEGAYKAVAVCDLDGNGQDDLVLRPPGAGARPLRMWLSLPDHLREVSGSQPFAAVDRNGTFVECVDLDLDEAPDLVLTARGVGGTERRLEFLHNDGTGHLSRVDNAWRGIAGNRAYIARLLRGDLDNDGLSDLVQLILWGGGHRVFQARPGGGLVDRRDGSGLEAQYDTPWFSWLTDVDADGLLDLVLAQETGMRAFRNQGDFRFEDATARWGLDGITGHQKATSMVDLDGDGDLDLVGQDGDRLLFALADPSGFTRQEQAFPQVPSTVSLLPVDLDADGDLDLLPWGAGAVGAYLNRSDKPLPSLSDWTSSSWIRRSAWLPTSRRMGLVLAGGTWWMIGMALFRRGSRIWLGRPMTSLPTLALVVGLGVFAADLQDTSWWLGLGAITLAAPAAGLQELRVHIDRTARRVGDYVLGPLLGRGGMGDVYLATDRDGRSVALKLVHPSLLARDEDRVVYRREAEHGAAVDDSRVVKILGYGEWTLVSEGRVRPTVFLVMEYLRGRTLRQLLDTHGPLPVDTAATLTRELALGLAAVHEAGLVHRDIKPDNISLTTDGSLKLMDFGAARRVGQMTRTAHNVLGTLGYLAPEQARGQPPTPATDIYAAGIVLYELLTGRRPHEATDVVSAITAILERPVPPLGRDDVPEALLEVLHRSLSPHPEQRPASATAFAEALQPFADPSTVAAITPEEAPLPAETRAGPGHAWFMLLLVRRYVQYVQSGGSPDLTVFALELLGPAQTTSAPPSGTVPATRPPDA